MKKWSWWQSKRKRLKAVGAGLYARSRESPGFGFHLPPQVETVKGRSDAALKRVNYTSWTTKLATTWSLRATPVLAHGGSSA